MRVEQTSALRSFSMSGLLLRPFAGEKLMLLRVDGEAGGCAPRHSHPHEQMSLVASGRVRFWLAGEERVVTAGEVVHIPCGVEHGAEFLETSVIYDIYHPVRQDMLDRLEKHA